MAEKNRILNSLGKYLLSGALLTGIGYHAADAQEIYSKLKINDNLKGKIGELNKRDSLVITKEQFEKLPASQQIRMSPFYLGSRDGKKIVPMYALPGFYESLSSEDHLFLKRAAQKPIGYFISDSIKGRKPVYLIEEGKKVLWYVGPAESSKETKEQYTKQKTKAGGLERKTGTGHKKKNSKLNVSQYAPKPDTSSKVPEYTPAPKTDSTKILERKKEQDRKYHERVRKDEEKMFEDRSETKPGKDTSATNLPEESEIKAVYQDNIEKAHTKFGLEAAVGTNSERVVGAFVDIPVTPWMNFEIFSNYYVGKGEPLSYEEQIETTIREKELIGPETYKQRTDEVYTTTEQKAVADAGIGLTLKLGQIVEFPFRIGANFANQSRDIDGKSTISFERNAQPIGDTAVITNAKDDEKYTKTNIIFSGGTMFNLTDNLSIGFSYNVTGKVNSGRINLRLGF